MSDKTLNPMETNSAHGFTEGSEFKTETKETQGKKHRPDFPEWMKSKEGEQCLQWPLTEVQYLRNRLFWAFDAGRNCVWDQYISQKSELQKAKELNGEFLLFANEMVTESNFPGCNYTIPSYWKIKLESLIKKSNP